MPEVTLRDGMVLVGSLLILAVMIDAWRRMRSQQRERVRLKLVPDVAGDEPGDDLTSFRELPNGGGRIVSRKDLLGSHGSGPSSKGSPSAESENPETGGGPDAGANSARGSKAAAGPKDVGKEPDKEPGKEPGKEPAINSLDGSNNIPTSTTVAGQQTSPARALPVMDSNTDGILEGMRADNHEPTNLDWLDDIPEQRSEAQEGDGEPARDVQTEVIILHVMSRNSEGFGGKDILEILLACDLRFGDMSFFHRHEQQAGRGPIQFSVANMLQPGVFDIDRMDSMYTRGLVFFITLPGPDDMIQAFDYMLETARVVARNLGGELLDESRSVLTQQAVEHSRQQIRELERRLLAQRG